MKSNHLPSDNISQDFYETIFIKPSNISDVSVTRLLQRIIFRISQIVIDIAISLQFSYFLFCWHLIIFFMIFMFNSLTTCLCAFLLNSSPISPKMYSAKSSNFVLQSAEWSGNFYEITFYYESPNSAQTNVSGKISWFSSMKQLIDVPNLVILLTITRRHTSSLTLSCHLVFTPPDHMNLILDQSINWWNFRISYL